MWICNKCKEELEDSFDTCWKCGYEKDSKIQSKKSDENEKVQIQRIEDEDNQIKDYPAIRFLSQVSIFLAWVGIFVGIIGYFIWLGEISEYNTSVMYKVMMFFAYVIGIFIYFIYWKAVSELLIIIVDIARDLRKIRLNKES